MTASQDTTLPTISPAQRLPLASSSATSLRRFAGLMLVTAVIAVLEITGRPPGLDPAVLVPMAVLAGAAIDGLVGGGIGAAVGGLYILLYFIDPAAAVAGAPARILAGLAATALALLVPLWLRDLTHVVERRARHRVEEANALVSFAGRLGADRAEVLPRTIVRGAIELLDADMAVLTVLNPPSGRHLVRAAHGGSGDSVGVEVQPGVGVTGQAINERRLIVARAASDASGVDRLQRRLQGRRTAQTMAAMPALQAGRVIATLTVGRTEGAPFSDDERELLEAIGPLITLAISGTLARREADEGTPRDSLTGLYNRAYLEEALEQLIALRRRSPPEQREPLSMLLFDIDGFAQINERHGRQVAEHVLRAVATVLRQRFRASDIVARVGPDSFVVVLNGALPETAAEAASQMRRQVHELNLASATGEPVLVSMSAGFAVYRDGEPADTLYRAAEAALEASRTAVPGAAYSGGMITA